MQCLPSTGLQEHETLPRVGQEGGSNMLLYKKFNVSPSVDLIAHPCPYARRRREEGWREGGKDGQIEGLKDEAFVWASLGMHLWSQRQEWGPQIAKGS